MIKNKNVLMAAYVVASLSACAGCSAGDSKSGDPVTKNHLSWYQIAKDGEEVHFLVTLARCRGEESRACYSAVALDSGSADDSGRSTEGDLTEEQLEDLNLLLTQEQLGYYEEDQDPECESAELRYVFSYDDPEGKNYFYCLLPGDHLSPETEHAIEVLTEMSEQLLKEGTPVEDKN